MLYSLYMILGFWFKFVGLSCEYIGIFFVFVCFMMSYIEYEFEG